MSAAEPPRSANQAPRIDVAFPDISRWAHGNTGVPYVWRFDAPTGGPRVTVQALTHGNEVCGATALDWLL
ncbi:MAG TPA: succinylglutamate desuccinylase, partial [Casimicrobiaceae bacterium]